MYILKIIYFEENSTCLNKYYKIARKQQSYVNLLRKSALTKARWYLTKASTVTHIVLTLSRVIVEYTYNMHQVFRREANQERFALPCKCARNNLFKCKSQSQSYGYAYIIFSVLHIFDTLPQQLMENHIKNSDTLADYIIPDIFRLFLFNMYVIDIT